MDRSLERSLVLHAILLRLYIKASRERDIVDDVPLGINAIWLYRKVVVPIYAPLSLSKCPDVAQNFDDEVACTSVMPPSRRRAS